MITIKEGRKAPVNPVAFVPGGGKFGYISIRELQAVGDLSGEKLTTLFPGGFISTSVGTMAATAATSNTMSMEKLSKVFLKELPYFMPYKTKNRLMYLRQALTDTRKLMYTHLTGKDCKTSTPLYNRTHMEEVINGYFRDICFADLQNNLFILTHKIGPDDEGPFDFYAVPRGIIKDSDLSKKATLNISLADAILASTAIPTVFPAYEIHRTGTLHVDMAHVDTGLVQMSLLSQNQDNGFNMGLVHFGTMTNDAPINEQLYNSQGFFQQIINQRLIDSPSRHVKSNDRNHLRNVLGQENYHILEYTPEDLKRFPISLDMLDTSKHTLIELKNSVDAYIEADPKDRIKRATDFLVENLERHQQIERQKNFCGPRPQASIPFNEQTLDTSPEGLKNFKKEMIDFIGKERHVSEETILCIDFLLSTIDETSNRKSLMSNFTRLFQNNKKTIQPQPPNQPNDNKPS